MVSAGFLAASTSHRYAHCMEIHGRQRGTRRVSLEVWDTTYMVVVVEGDEILAHEEYPDLKTALEAYRWTK